MAVAVLFSLTVVSAGFGALRALGVGRGVLGLGLAPATGLGVLAVVASWSVLLGAPAPVPGVLVYGIALVGLALAVADRAAVVLAVRGVVSEQGLAVATLIAALVVPMIVQGVAFGS